MNIHQVRRAANELVAIPRQVNNALAMAFVAMMIAAAALIIIVIKEI